MKTHHPPHGSVELRHSGRVIVMRFVGAFNREGVLQLGENLGALWEQMGQPERWATLADLREWEGSTEDSLEAAVSLLGWMHAHGHVAEARLFTNSLMPRIVSRQQAQHPAGLLEQHFRDETQAWAWLASLGFERDAPSQNTHTSRA